MLPKWYRGSGIAKQTQIQFGGYDRRPEAADGTFYDTCNLTAQEAPVLRARDKRSVAALPYHVGAMCGTDALLTVNRESGYLYYNGWLLCALRYGGEHTAVRFGEKMIFFPDKQMVNLQYRLKGSVQGETELPKVAEAAEGDAYAVRKDGGGQEDPVSYIFVKENGRWVDHGNVLSELEAKVNLETPYIGVGTYQEVTAQMNTIKIESDTVDFTTLFRAGDGLKISGCSKADNNLTVVVREVAQNELRFYENTFRLPNAHIYEVTEEELPVQDSSGRKLWYCFGMRVNLFFQLDGEVKKGDTLLWSSAQEGIMRIRNGEIEKVAEEPIPDTVMTEEMQNANWLYFEYKEDLYTDVRCNAPGLHTEGRYYTERSTVTIERSLPEMDFVFADSNRLWGCRDSTIYASALGKPDNFYVFDNISSDSYSVEVFSPGRFTGAVSLNGFPTFYKQNVKYKLYGDRPKNFQSSEISCIGVMSGCHRTMAISNGTLYYLSRAGVMADTGAEPVRCGQALGNEPLVGGLAAATDEEYFLCAETLRGETKTFSLQTGSGIWLHEDNTAYKALAEANSSLFGVYEKNGKDYAVSFAKYGQFDEFDLQDMKFTPETEIASSAETNDYVLSTPNRKRVHRLQLRLELEENAQMKLLIQYDSAGTWLPVWTLQAGKKQSYYLPLQLHRCDHFRLKLEAVGQWKLHSMAIAVKTGSAIH